MSSFYRAKSAPGPSDWAPYRPASHPGHLPKPTTPGSAAGDNAWSLYARAKATNNENFRGNWFFEPPSNQYYGLKGRTRGNFQSRSTPCTWGLTDMDWFNREKKEAVYGPSRYGSCAGMMTYTEAFNKSLISQDPTETEHFEPGKTLSPPHITRNTHRMHDLQMLGKLTRGSAILTQRPH
jgi:hypothetical protein